MKIYFLETSAIINYLRNKEKAVETVNDLEGELTSSFVCLAELYEGVYRVKKWEPAKQLIKNFFSGLNRVFGLDEEIVETFGKIRAGLKEKGKIIEDLDLLIAATCLANNLILVTYNPKHFQRIKNLRLLTPK